MGSGFLNILLDGYVLYSLLFIGARVGLAFIPAAAARKRGYSFGGFWVFGFFLFVPSLIVVAFLTDRPGR